MSTTRRQIRKMLTNIMKRNAIIMENKQLSTNERNFAKDILFLAKILKYVEGNGTHIGIDKEFNINLGE